MKINTNVNALNAWRQLSANQNAMSKSLEKLSSGRRINRASDDAAGLAISEKMRGQVRGLYQAIRNAQHGISLIQTAEGALGEVHSVLQRMRELSVQVSSGTMAPSDRLSIKVEMDALCEEITRIGQKTTFNSLNLLDGTCRIKILVGAQPGEEIEIELKPVSILFLDLNHLNTEDGESALEILDAAIQKISGQRAHLGALQNRLEHTVRNLETSAENLTAAESRIRDIDIALEMANFTRHEILLQAGTAMLAQANLIPKSILDLLEE